MFGIDNFIDGRSLQSLGNSVRQMFESISVQAQAKWFKQHDGDGGHTNVTAASVTASALLKTLGRFSLGPAVFLNEPAEDATKPLFLGRNDAAFVRIRTDSGSGDTVIHGLSAVGREEGDVVVFMNVGNWILKFVQRVSSDAPVGTRFIWAGPTDLEVGSFSLAIAIYAHNTFLNETLWHLFAGREV